MPSNLELGLYVFVLATFVGLEIIRKVSPLLHTPLMSLTNAISAISVAVSYTQDVYKRQLHIQVPIVVRMEGTNVDLGRQILLESGLNFNVGADMRDAAEKVVKLAA